MNERQNQGLQTLKDVSKTGKDRQWRERKLKNIELAAQLETLGYRSFERVYQCAEVLKFVEQMDGTKKLYQSYFCKNKLCALCNWRRSMKLFVSSKQDCRRSYEQATEREISVFDLNCKKCERSGTQSSYDRYSYRF